MNDELNGLIIHLNIPFALISVNTFSDFSKMAVYFLQGYITSKLLIFITLAYQITVIKI